MWKIFDIFIYIYMHTYTVFITCKFQIMQIFKFTWSLKFVCNPNINSQGALEVICRHAHVQSGEYLESSSMPVSS